MADPVPQLSQSSSRIEVTQAQLEACGSLVYEIAVSYAVTASSDDSALLEDVIARSRAIFNLPERRHLLSRERGDSK
jgi:hypothetical protein